MIYITYVHFRLFLSHLRSTLGSELSFNIKNTQTEFVKKFGMALTEENGWTDLAIRKKVLAHVISIYVFRYCLSCWTYLDHHIIIC